MDAARLIAVDAISDVVAGDFMTMSVAVAARAPAPADDAVRLVVVVVAAVGRSISHY